MAMVYASRSVTHAGSYETRGTVWNELPIAGSIGGNGKTATWMPLTLQDFITTLITTLVKNRCSYFRKLAANQRTVDKDMIVYTTTVKQGG